MSGFFKPNIDKRGRISRGIIGLFCLIVGIVVVMYQVWPGVVLLAAGVFTLFEAVRGWCVARACGIKTKV